MRPESLAMIDLVLLLVALDAGAPTPTPTATATPTPRALPLAPAQPGVEARADRVYRLRRSGARLVYEDRRFRATVEPDGAVSFHDKGGVGWALLPLPVPQALPEGTPTLVGSLRDATSRERRTERRLAAAGIPPTGAPPAPGGTGARPPPVEICDARSACAVESSALVVTTLGTFDLTDELVRGLKAEDPYRYEKARFLAATLELRARLARSHLRQASSRALADLPERLEQTWTDARFAPAERRRLIYDLWAEASDDAEGRRAAAAIEGFVRHRLPRGTPAGYSDAELARYGAGPGRPFRPYGP